MTLCPVCTTSLLCRVREGFHTTRVGIMFFSLSRHVQHCSCFATTILFFSNEVISPEDGEWDRLVGEKEGEDMIKCTLLPLLECDAHSDEKKVHLSLYLLWVELSQGMTHWGWSLDPLFAQGNEKKRKEDEGGGARCCLFKSAAQEKTGHQNHHSFSFPSSGSLASFLSRKQESGK